jgi:NAD(P)-dependent dehydrogenase (short-subunit alcohol dehydrogenase family)
MRPLEGKAVLVTGAGRGIGAAIARDAAAAGARVLVNDLDAGLAETLAAEIGGLADGADVRDPDAAERMVARCVEAFGRIDGLVNNAGIFGVARLEDETAERLQAILAVNVIGVFNCARAAVRRMYAQGGGSIVNVVSGAQAGIELMSAYGASKGALAAMTYAWAIEAAPTGVRVNAVSPRGATRLTEVLDDHRRKKGLPPGTSPAPESNAPVVTYLLSDAAAGVNGQVVRIDGRGLSLMTHPAVAAPVLDRDDWSFEAVAAAFEGELARRQQPLGIAALHVAPASLPDTRPWPPRA